MSEITYHIRRNRQDIVTCCGDDPDPHDLNPGRPAFIFDGDGIVSLSPCDKAVHTRGQGDDDELASQIIRTALYEFAHK